MKTLKSFFLSAALLMLPAMLFADAAYYFNKPVPGLKFSGSAYIRDGLLHIDGGGKVELPDSAQYNVTPAGLTMSAVIRLKNSPRDFGQDFFSKENEWFFGRHNKGMLFIQHFDGKKWYGGVRAGAVVPAGEWAHYTAAFERIQRSGQGQVGYRVKVYINGEQVGSTTVFDHDPQHTQAPVIFGYGPAKDAWAMNGQAAVIKIWKRTLSDDEIERDALESKLVRVAGLQREEVTAGLKAKLPLLPENLQAAMIRAAENGADQAMLAAAIPAIAAGKPNDAVEIINNGLLQAVVLKKAIGKAQALVSVYDLVNKAELLGRRGLSWTISVKRNNQSKRIADVEVPASVSMTGKYSFEVKWSVASMTVIMPVKLDGARLEAGLKVENPNQGVILEEVMFPRFAMHKIPGKDVLAMPFMSGIELKNPTVEQAQVAQQDYFYPTSDINMQFCAYYNGKQGVYIACEDPAGDTKRIAYLGKRGEMCVNFTHPVGFTLEGANSWQLSGNAVLQAYSGNWYEGALIYKKFVNTKANWRITELPRKDTPQWLRNNTMCVAISNNMHHGRYAYTQKQMVAELIALREYMELPFMLHWGDWYDINKAAWPHYYPFDATPGIMRELNKHGIYADGYTDPRLWAEKDGPGEPGSKENWMFKPLGENYAVRNENNTIPREGYYRWSHNDKKGWHSSFNYFYVMCPACPGWQDWILWMCRRAAASGLNGIYHDQVTAAQPYTCYSDLHGHIFNDAKMWVTNGYIPMMKAVRNDLKKRYPELIHSSEDICEPYLQCFDYGYCWRWTHEQIPLFGTIYGGGRIQLGWRMYGDGGKLTSTRQPADINAFYAKAAEQVVRGEQLGYFIKEDIRSPQGMLCAKRMIHLRTALLSYFNNADMLKNLEYKEPMPTVKTRWNAYGGGSGGGGMITTPVIRQGYWQRLSDNAKMLIFVNGTMNSCTFTPVNVPEGSYIALAGKVEKYTGQAITLSGQGAAVIFCGKTALQEAEVLAKVLQKIANFKPMTQKTATPAPAAQKQNKQVKTTPLGAFTPADASKINGAVRAENNSFIGWMAVGASIEFASPAAEAAAAEMDVEGQAGQIIRVIIANREVVRGKLPANGRQKIRLKFNQKIGGKTLLHFPEGMNRFYRITFEK